jgi:uncharacterized protein YraI
MNTYRQNTAFVRRLVPAVAVVALALALRTFVAQAAGSTASVNVDALNLRAGPGFGHLILRVLPYDQALNLIGRSKDGAWVEVRLPDESGGWVYARYLKTQAAVGKLPVTQAAGGPAGAGSGVKGYSLSMTIVDNVASVTIERYPANAEIVVMLSRSDGSGEVQVTQGVADAAGSAQFTFEMPPLWSDGQPVREASLRLRAATADGTFSRQVSIQYYR